MIFIIYKATFKNKKSYIGFTSRTLHIRKLEHKSLSKNPKTYFQRSLNKYQTAKWSILYQCNDITLAKKMEKIFIQEYKTYDCMYGYNLTLGGEGVIGLVHTQETKEKIKKAVRPSMAWRKPQNNLKNYYRNNPEARSIQMKKIWKNRNMEYALKNLTGTGKPKKPISLIKYDVIFNFESLTAASKITKVHISALSGLLSKTVKSAKGYKLYKDAV